jgi:uncharacterized protein (TIGR03067 family)
MRPLIGLFVLAFLSCSPPSETTVASDGSKATNNKEPMRTDAEKLEGAWQATSVETDGKKAPADFAARIQMRFDKGFLMVKGLFGDNREVACQLKLDSDKKPKTIDYTGLGTKQTVLGIYELDGDTLKLCIVTRERERPKEFKTEAGSNLTLLELKRVKK